MPLKAAVISLLSVFILDLILVNWARAVAASTLPDRTDFVTAATWPRRQLRRDFAACPVLVTSPRYNVEQTPDVYRALLTQVKKVLEGLV